MGCTFCTTNDEITRSHLIACDALVGMDLSFGRAVRADADLYDMCITGSLAYMTIDLLALPDGSPVVDDLDREYGPEFCHESIVCFTVGAFVPVMLVAIVTDERNMVAEVLALRRSLELVRWGVVITTWVTTKGEVRRVHRMMNRRNVICRLMWMMGRRLRRLCVLNPRCRDVVYIGWDGRWVVLRWNCGWRIRDAIVRAWYGSAICTCVLIRRNDRKVRWMGL